MKLKLQFQRNQILLYRSLFNFFTNSLGIFQHIDGVMVSVLTINLVVCGLDYKISINRFSAKHAALRSKRKDWLARNKDNVLE